MRFYPIANAHKTTHRSRLSERRRFIGDEDGIFCGQLIKLVGDAGDIAQKGTAITKAIDIILNGLRASLDLEAGGNLAQNLYALYDYMARRLLHANINNDGAALDEVLGLLNEIHSAWIAIGQQLEADDTESRRVGG